MFAHGAVKVSQRSYTQGTAGDVVVPSEVLWLTGEEVNSYFVGNEGEGVVSVGFLTSFASHMYQSANTFAHKKTSHCCWSIAHQMDT